MSASQRSRRTACQPGWRTESRERREQTAYIISYVKADMSAGWELHELRWKLLSVLHRHLLIRRVLPHGPLPAGTEFAIRLRQARGRRLSAEFSRSSRRRIPSAHRPTILLLGLGFSGKSC